MLCCSVFLLVLVLFRMGHCLCQGIGRKDRDVIVVYNKKVGVPGPAHESMRYALLQGEPPASMV